MSVKPEETVSADGRPLRKNGRFYKGGPSGNPKGRPRTGMAFTERVRAKVDIDELIEIAVSIAQGHGVTIQSGDAVGAHCVAIPSARDRLAACTFLRDSAYCKPPQLIATADITPKDDVDLNYEALPDDVLDDYLRANNRAAVALGLPDLIDGMVTDETEYIDVESED